MYLLTITRKVDGLYRFFTQWATTAVAILYFIIVALLGYNVQPLIDFRSFPAGKSLIGDADAENNNQYKFIYEKNGEEGEFLIDDLPDSTWTFVDRKLMSGSESEATEFVVMDGEENVSSDIISEDGEEIIIVVPQGERADVSYTYLINELWRYITTRGGEFIELVAMPREQIEHWIDLSMATYPVYSADGTMLKEMSRGDMSAVYLRDGVVVWKRSLASIDVDLFSNVATNSDVLEQLDPHGERLFLWLSMLLLILLQLLWTMSESRTLFLLRHRFRKKRNS